MRQATRLPASLNALNDTTSVSFCGLPKQADNDGAVDPKYLQKKDVAALHQKYFHGAPFHYAYTLHTYLSTRSKLHAILTTALSHTVANAQ
jgi:hypothetical protein